MQNSEEEKKEEIKKINLLKEELLQNAAVKDELMT